MTQIAIEKRLLSAKEAATYCGLGEQSFKAHCPLRPLKIGPRTRWDRHEIDRWIDQKSNISNPVRSGVDMIEEIFGDEDENQ